MEDQDRRQFNQGLRRSLRNGVFLSLLSAGIITASVIGLSAGLSYILSGRMSYGPSDEIYLGLSIVWQLLLCGWLVVWAATGGLTILRHYLIRLLLARSRTFLWRARAFLDDATARVLLRRVGGGYGFVHRRLLNYFAAYPAMSDESSSETETRGLSRP